MATVKRVLCPERLRRVPDQFSWIDHRLVRDRRIAGRSAGALALYLFLVTVADGQGLSYYSDATAGRLLGMDISTLCRARRELAVAGLIAYQSPLYQILSLDDPVAGLPAGRGEPPRPRNHRPLFTTNSCNTRAERRHPARLVEGWGSERRTGWARGRRSHARGRSGS